MSEKRHTTFYWHLIFLRGCKVFWSWHRMLSQNGFTLSYLIVDWTWQYIAIKISHGQTNIVTDSSFYCPGKVKVKIKIKDGWGGDRCGAFDEKVKGEIKSESENPKWKWKSKLKVGEVGTDVVHLIQSGSGKRQLGCRQRPIGIVGFLRECWEPKLISINSLA